MPTFNSGTPVSAGGSYTSPLTLYATEAECARIWSQYGVDSRVDDNDDDDVSDNPEPGNLESIIEKAVCDVNFYLLNRYTVAVCAASQWVKWATAIFACVYLAERRGNTIPKSLQADYDRYLEMLKAIGAGEAALMGDNGPAAMAFDSTPIVSNFTVERRTGRSRIRRTNINSTDATPTSPRKQKPAFEQFRLYD